MENQAPATVPIAPIAAGTPPETAEVFLGHLSKHYTPDQINAARQDYQTRRANPVPVAPPAPATMVATTPEPFSKAMADATSFDGRHRVAGESLHLAIAQGLVTNAAHPSLAPPADPSGYEISWSGRASNMPTGELHARDQEWRSNLHKAQVPQAWGKGVFNAWSDSIAAMSENPNYVASRTDPKAATSYAQSFANQRAVVERALGIPFLEACETAKLALAAMDKGFVEGLGAAGAFEQASGFLKLFEIGANIKARQRR
jgi:hypothetical protein